MDCSQWPLLTATADAIGKYESHYLLVLRAKNEKVFHDIFKQLVQKENKEQTVKLTDAEDPVSWKWIKKN